MSRIPVRIVADQAQTLYAKQPKVYPREIDGRFQRLRIAAVFWLLGMFYGIPWLSWQGQQVVLFDLPARKFHIFGLTFWPQDFFLLTWLLVIAALSLFFFTALAGRLWCGYACPQTVWTEVFLWFERVIEGDRNRRMKRDAGPWTQDKIVRKTAKQWVWVTFALWTGFTFVGFFTPIRELGHEVLSSSLGGWETFWILFYGFATYGNAGYLREQVCKYMCPYARFQSAMFDKDTLIISYDVVRGEPRGSRKKTADPRSIGLGDCIECEACVQVCPTGIDIRKGLQIDCIACAACIDACDGVMDKMGYLRGLIRYTTEHQLLGKARHIVRARTIIYAVLLMVLIGGFIVAVTLRKPVIVDVIHDRNALFRVIADGFIENSYTVKLTNKTDRPMHFSMQVKTDLPIVLVGRERIMLEPGEVTSAPLTLRSTTNAMHGKHSIHVVFTQDGEQQESSLSLQNSVRFFAPEEK